MLYAQAIELRNQLAVMDLPQDVLWVTSPLTRAIQTLTLACPALHSGGPKPNIAVRRWVRSLQQCRYVSHLQAPRRSLLDRHANS